ncbi:hypothetical protein E1091_00145 [Micromonospora fluostatini]|uniref:DUF3846 domain-containing protein n=1 Tax=Micromonospora fluostatini TaxID=1629071 RepID=A0ABY2DMY5_9ACTN|nr:hypothetical protein E1091_00145 [Micromonospora fluostatini]
MTIYTAEQVIEIGGREWEKKGKYRVYLNDDIWPDLIGLKVERYNTGNICAAWLDGDRISNSRANDILLAIAKVYWDSADGQIHIWTRSAGRYIDEVPGWIRAGIAKAAAVFEEGADLVKPDTHQVIEVI